MKRVLAMVAALFALAVPTTFAVAHAEPVGSGVPDLSKYQLVPNDPFLTNGEVYFQTPGGLLCAIRSAPQWAGCDGQLPGSPQGANEVVLADQSDRGWYQTENPRFVRTTGGAAPVLRAGQKIAFLDYECAVDATTTTCTKGTPAAAWFTVSPDGASIGPSTPGLPENFPDPQYFVTSSKNYVVGQGPKNMFPTFSVAHGLTCKIILFSGGSIGCNGPLAGVSHGENEVYIELPGAVGIRKADAPTYSQPAYPGPVEQLPAGFKISQGGGTCMATEDGGVACYGELAEQISGFVASPTATWTF